MRGQACAHQLEESQEVAPHPGRLPQSSSSHRSGVRFTRGICGEEQRGSRLPTPRSGSGSTPGTTSLEPEHLSPLLLQTEQRVPRDCAGPVAPRTGCPPVPGSTPMLRAPAARQAKAMTAPPSICFPPPRRSSWRTSARKDKASAPWETTPSLHRVWGYPVAGGEEAPAAGTCRHSSGRAWRPQMAVEEARAEVPQGLGPSRAASGTTKQEGSQHARCSCWQGPMGSCRRPSPSWTPCWWSWCAMRSCTPAGWCSGMTSPARNRPNSWCRRWWSGP
mmetsp:Transcript_21609/g.60059  ORF Transcript_21609/g.60059 Transcript_21609/m.60059 type:complete len:276 (+) Transcript_21609:584-1411(+)